MAKSTNVETRMVDYLKKYKIFIDTCALLEPQCDKFWDFVEPHLRAAGEYIIIPQACVKELEDLANNPFKRVHQRAKVVIGKINRRIRHGIIRVYGDPTDPFSDATLQMAFAKYRVNYKLMLITHDKKLARDILRFNNSESVFGHRILVEDFSPDGSCNLVSHKMMAKKKKKKKVWHRGCLAF